MYKRISIRGVEVGGKRGVEHRYIAILSWRKGLGILMR